MKWFSLFFLILFVACSSKKTVATESSQLLSLDRVEQWDVIIAPLSAPVNLFTDTLSSMLCVSPQSVVPGSIPDFRPVRIVATKKTTASGSVQLAETKQEVREPSAVDRSRAVCSSIVGVCFIIIVVIVMVKFARLVKRCLRLLG